jgi:hypothetical protein
MNEATKTPLWFWIISSVLLLWNLVGVMAYIAQVSMSPEAMAALPAPERALYESTPAWANAAFAVAVWAGTLGCALLLLKRASAFYVLLTSLLGVLVQMSHSFFMSQSFDVYGPGAAIMPVIIILIAGFLVWFSLWAKERAWLR